VKVLEKQPTKVIMSIMLQLVQAYRYENFEKSELKKFFFSRVFENLNIANSFHWLVHLDKNNDKNNEGEVLARYCELYTEFMDELEEKHPAYYANIKIQQDFRKNTVETAYKIRDCPGLNDEQVKLLRKNISNGTDSDLTNLNNGEGVPLSANLDITLHGVTVDKTKVFKSATRPLLLPFYFR